MTLRQSAASPSKFSAPTLSGLSAAPKSRTSKIADCFIQIQVDANGKPLRSADIFAPNIVMSILKKHYERYNFEVVSSITGASFADIKFAVTWNYSQDYMVEYIMREVNGYDLSTGKLLNGIGEIKDDGTNNL